mmetsp:Transcript_16654/g.53192  ORF Transcript_16654/g.53192 Transcript_16654/m.53192 type:complete len:205 (-) Transcript_16654:7-621(-)
MHMHISPTCTGLLCNWLLSNCCWGWDNSVALLLLQLHQPLQRRSTSLGRLTGGLPVPPCVLHQEANLLVSGREVCGPGAQHRQLVPAEVFQGPIHTISVLWPQGQLCQRKGRILASPESAIAMANTIVLLVEVCRVPHVIDQAADADVWRAEITVELPKGLTGEAARGLRSHGPRGQALSSWRPRHRLVRGRRRRHGRSVGRLP